MTPAQQRLNDLWDDHMRFEFATRDTGATLATMVDDAYVNHVPVLTGGVGLAQLREFHSTRFIAQIPPDTAGYRRDSGLAHDRLRTGSRRNGIYLYSRRGDESARNVLDPRRPVNALMHPRWQSRFNRDLDPTTRSDSSHGTSLA
ncbi:MAG: hypothetical protein ABI843_10295 [Dokdonella sp.]